MQAPAKEAALKIAENTSSIYSQGSSWVFKEFDFESGLTRLTRGLSLKMAKKRLRDWRKEQVELLLRGDGEQSAYVMRVFHEKPEWDGNGVWHFLGRRWFTTLEEAEEQLKKKQETFDRPHQCEVVEMKTKDLPGHFSIL